MLQGYNKKARRLPSCSQTISQGSNRKDTADILLHTHTHKQRAHAIQIQKDIYWLFFGWLNRNLRSFREPPITLINVKNMYMFIFCLRGRFLRNNRRVLIFSSKSVQSYDFFFNNASNMPQNIVFFQFCIGLRWFCRF